jgi:hydroxypyruvate isomerase
MPIRYSANLSFLFTELPFEERFTAAAGAGFSFVECMYPYELDAAALRARLQETGLQMVLFSMWPGEFAAGDRGLLTDPRRRDEFRRGLDLTLQYAQTLDCQRVHAIVGNQPAGISYEVARACLVENLREAAGPAAQIGLMLTIEPLNVFDFPQFFLRRTEEAVQILRDVDRPNVKLQFDCYHVQITQGNLTDSFMAHLPDIGHVQIADVPGRHEPGTGEISYPFVLRTIGESPYNGYVGLEYRPTTNTEDSLAWLPRGARGSLP